MSSIADLVVASLRQTAHAFASGDQTAPSAVLWTDPDRQWESALAAMLPLVPELFVLGAYAPAQRTGPALWLRSLEARVVDGAPAAGVVPVFYLPGISRERLREAEECPPELAALVELQYRGSVWLHVNGKDWTPYAFLVSGHGGANLDVAKDQATLDSLARALPVLISEPLTQLRGKRLDAESFNALLAPDSTGLMLRWLSNQELTRAALSDAEWSAFCQQCASDLQCDPRTDGPLKAARLLAARNNGWKSVWKRFADVPTSYPGVVNWLNKAAPKQPDVFDSAEVWPSLNDAQERDLRTALESVGNTAAHDAAARLRDLDLQHGPRRAYPWPKLGLSPLATALEPLARLAALSDTAPGGPSMQAYAETYVATAWQVDAAALDVMAACTSLEQYGPVLGALRAVYLPWLEGTARHLQHLMRDAGTPPVKRAAPLEGVAGRVVVFADGLRMDVAQRLHARLHTAGLTAALDWEWSTVPSVTATAKPAASPLAAALHGAPGDGFEVRLTATGQKLTQDRFLTALKGMQWQCLTASETGDASGWAWTEAGTLDKKGHTDGWKLARSIDSELQDLVSRIRALVASGWRDIIIVTDHGWLLMPNGLPKVELKAFLADDRWGRCASLKDGAQTDSQVFPWHWNTAVSIASPPGVGCYRANMEYTHGGVSLQEMITPVLRVSAGAAAGALARLATAKWTGAMCRITLTGDAAGATVDVRTNLSDAASSLLESRQVRPVSDGKVTVYLENDADIGRPAEIVLMNADGQVIDTLSTTLGA